MAKATIRPSKPVAAAINELRKFELFESGYVLDSAHLSPKGVTLELNIMVSGMTAEQQKNPSLTIVTILERAGVLDSFELERIETDNWPSDEPKKWYVAAKLIKLHYAEPPRCKDD